MDHVSATAGGSTATLHLEPEAALPAAIMTDRAAPFDPEAALSPFKVEQWRHLTPSQRLERAWALRARLINPRDVHDRKLFPAP